MEQESTVCQYPPAPLQMEQFPPLPKLLLGCGQSLAHRSQCQQGAQCPAITTGASSLICCAQLQKTQPTQLLSG